jgi:hypothetical protein
MFGEKILLHRQVVSKGRGHDLCLAEDTPIEAEPENPEREAFVGYQQLKGLRGSQKQSIKVC